MKRLFKTASITREMFLQSTPLYKIKIFRNDYLIALVPNRKFLQLYHDICIRRSVNDDFAFRISILLLPFAISPPSQ